MKPIDFAAPQELQTPRLRLRGWRESDVPSFVALCADPEVMQYFPEVLTEPQVHDYVIELQDRFRRWGFGYWAVEAEDAPFAGFVGLSRPNYKADFTPCVEVGWRLHKAHWGKGYATEAARAALRFGFEDQQLEEVVAIVSTDNVGSCAVAERLGMSRNPDDDFDYLDVSPTATDWPYRACVLYRIKNDEFVAQTRNTEPTNP